MALRVKDGWFYTMCKKVKQKDAFGNRKSDKYGIYTYCKKCVKVYNSEYRRDNPDKTKTAKDKWNKENPGYMKACMVKYYKNNIDKSRAYSTKWSKENPEKAKINLANYRKNNPDNVKASNAKWRKNNKEYFAQWKRDNPDKVREYGYRRRAHKLAALGNFTAKEFIKLCNNYDNICLRCRKLKKLAADHVIPLSKGGANYIENIQPLCKSCNSTKGTKKTDYRKLAII